jgi:lipoprotein-anchoring transpeptidase ErfK/SrfK
MRPDDGLRRWVPGPDRAGAATADLWVDIDVEQQMLGLRSGSGELLYVTLISGGLPERPTPLGTYRVQYKRAYKSMGNRPDSADKYFVENVPWVMYFSRYYAVHGAYWHDEFGKQRSHGCVNLAPRDAAYLYHRIAPISEPGFFTTFASERTPGAVVRVRDSGDAPSRVALD